MAKKKPKNKNKTKQKQKKHFFGKKKNLGQPTKYNFELKMLKCLKIMLTQSLGVVFSLSLSLFFSNRPTALFLKILTKKWQKSDFLAKITDMIFKRFSIFNSKLYFAGFQDFFYQKSDFLPFSQKNHHF